MVQKELTLSTELGVFVDKQGNCYNADGVSIAYPDAIQNAQSDFLQISEVFSLNEDNEDLSKDVKATSPEDTLKKPPIITVIPEAKSGFTKPLIRIIPTNLMVEPTAPKIVETRSKTNSSRSLVKKEPSNPSATAMEMSSPLITPVIIEPKPEMPEPIFPIIVDVRSESTDLCSPNLPMDSPVDDDIPKNNEISESEIKTEPCDCVSGEKEDDEETLTASESTYDSIQGIIDNIPETDNNCYVDVPEFVHINNFSLKDLDELRRKQEQAQNSNLQTGSDVTVPLTFKNISEFIQAFKPASNLPKILPKPDSKKSQNLADQLKNRPTKTRMSLQGMLKYMI